MPNERGRAGSDIKQRDSGAGAKSTGFKSREAVRICLGDDGSEQERSQQREEFLALLDSMDAASEEEIDRFLADREHVEPVPELSTETISKVRAMIKESKRLNRAE